MKLIKKSRLSVFQSGKFTVMTFKFVPPIQSALIALTMSSVVQAAAVIGTINFSSAPGSGVVLQDVNGMVTTNLAAATAVQSWLVPEVDGTSGSFISVPAGQSVVYSQPWIFAPSTPITLWTTMGMSGFSFNLASSSIALQNANFLLISGTGTVTSPDFDPTPAVWAFTTQRVATDGKFSWSASLTAVPEVSTTALLGGALLSFCFCRRRTNSIHLPHP